MYPVGEGDQVVVALDRGCLAASLARTALDDVGIDRALRQELHGFTVVRNLLGHSEEFLPELLADDATLRLRVAHTRQQLGIAILGMHVDEIHVELLGEYLFDLFRLVLAQKPMVHEHAHQLLADRLRAQRRNNARIHAPESPRITRSLSTCSRMAATESSMIESMVQFGSSPAIPNRKFASISWPYGVWRTSGWNCVA